MENTKVKLPKKFKEKWLKALRSGKYKQTKGMLYNPKTGGMCCIGVACHLKGISKDLLRPHGMPKKSLIGFSNIPKYLDNWSGNEKMEQVLGNLSGMNDSGKRFKTIANWIEKNL